VRKLKKVLFTLNIDNYAPDITALTYPLLRHWARKIDAEFQVITERKFPEWPVVYEKLQIHELGRGNDWNIYVDSDALVHPDFYDPTDHIPKDTVCHYGMDMAGHRWKYDQYFRRDGRDIGSCNWFTIGSDWCIDLWKPLDDLTPEQAIANISSTVAELSSGVIHPSHLIDDYTLSRNIAKFGLHFTTIKWIQEKLRDVTNHFCFHQYTLTEDQKLDELLKVVGIWKIQEVLTKAGYKGRLEPKPAPETKEN
jgi:hypothetical protein